jgi:hypothetical protein
MARKDPLEVMTIKIHPRWAGKILEALALAQTHTDQTVTDPISRVVIRTDYAFAANTVGRALGDHMATAPGHDAWRRWLSDRVIAFARKIYDDEAPDKGGF